MVEYTKDDLRKIKGILRKVETAARCKVGEIGCAKAARIFHGNMGYFSQIANGKRTLSAKQAVKILETIQEYAEK